MTESALLRACESILRLEVPPPGLQAYASRDRTCIGDVAIGTASHGSMTSDTLHALWCQAKPIVALAAARLLELGGWAPTATLVEIGIRHPYIPGTLTVADILGHSTRIVNPIVGHAKMWPPQVRHTLFAEVGGPKYPPAETSGYSEYSTWELLGQFIEQRTGTDVPTYLQQLADQQGIKDLVFSPAPEFFESWWEDRVGCYYSVDHSPPIPFLHDLAPSFACDFLAGSGGFATMRALGMWYEELLDVLRGRPSRYGELFPSPGYLNELVAAHRGPRHDAVLDQHVDFGAGLLLGDLSPLCYGSGPSPTSMAHFGWSWSSWTLVDPENAVVLTVLLNGVSTVRDRWDDARRATVEAVYQKSPEYHEASHS